MERSGVNSLSDDELKDYINGTLQAWSVSLETKIDVGGMLSRSQTAHKWHITFFYWGYREAVMWRIYTLLNQSYTLAEKGMFLGAMVILRAAIETLAALIYVNRKTTDLISNRISFRDFRDIVGRLIMGASDREATHKPIKVGDMIRIAEKDREGIHQVYEQLCQIAHPNLDGVAAGFSKFDREQLEMEFGDYFEEKHRMRYFRHMASTIKICDTEYNTIWPENLPALEKWLEKNDVKLEAKRSAKIKKAKQKSPRP